ncbi:MAG: hypothetical protein VX320_03655 [Candidatus Thermoplasmatota archaeon]|nr:hypothetical protein [Candidatus Thermoplasmatota archaeon]
MVDIAPYLIFNLVIGLVCLGYAYYCFLNGGTHARGKGWVTREEGPKTVLFSMIFYALIGLSSLCVFAYKVFLS